MTVSVSPLLDIEQEFINHLAKSSSFEYILREGVSADLLLTPLAKGVFAFVQYQFNETGKVPSLRVLESEFSAASFDEPDTTASYVVDKLRERFQRNEIGKILDESARLATNDPSAAMDRLRSRVFEVEKNTLSQRHVWSPGDHTLFLHDLQQKIQAGAYKGVTIGFPEIDAFTGGIKDGWAVYILARQKRKKTFFTLNAFIKQTLEDANPYLFTLENTESEIMLRISCMISGYSWDLAQKGIFDSKAWKMINTAWSDFSKHPHHIEMPPLDERTMNHFALKADKVDAGPMLISQFKYIDGARDRYRADHEERADVAVDIKRTATRQGKERPIIVEAQFNRGGDSMEELEDFDGGKVGLTDMIPQSADALYGLFESKDLRANGQIEYGILEARNHDRASWYVKTELKTKTSFDLVPGTQH